MIDDPLYWLTPETVEREHKTARDLLDNQGIIISTDMKLYEIARSAFQKIALAMPKLILHSTLRLVYVYDQREQPNSHIIRTSDGFSSVSERLKDGKRVSSVGISKQALEYSEEYIILVLLHELAHVTVNGQHNHDETFHCWLDYLIAEYNDFHGTQIINDYI